MHALRTASALALALAVPAASAAAAAPATTPAVGSAQTSSAATAGEPRPTPPRKPAPGTKPPAKKTPAKKTPAKKAPAKRHRFIVKFEQTKIPGMKRVRDNLVKQGSLQRVIEGLADDIDLPRDVPVTFKDCGDANAFWSPDAKNVTMCYDLISLYSRTYDDAGPQEKVFLKGLTKDQIVYGTTLFIFLHETGHGLVDLFKVPTTGREEDAVDQFATVVLASNDKKGTKPENRMARHALLGAYFFKLVATAPDQLGREVFADEHSLGQTRYYDVMCLTLGSDEDAWAPVIVPGLIKAEAEIKKAKGKLTPAQIQAIIAKHEKENILPTARAGRCSTEYTKYRNSWSYLINTFMVKPAANKPATKKPGTTKPAPKKPAPTKPAPKKPAA